MDTITINRLICDSYRSAKNKGFYTSKVADEAYIAGIHDELSEAFECWNKHDLPDKWYVCKSLQLTLQQEVYKEDGVYPELADAVIRLFSYCGYKGLELKQVNLDTDRPYTKDDLCDLILKSHATLANFYELIVRDIRDDYEEKLLFKCIVNELSTFVARIELFIAQSSNNDFNLYELITRKLAYNSTREYKHGSHKV